MCGVAGIFDLEGRREIDRAALKRMADAIAHRGPDAEGFFSAPGIGLAHRRLAIIDPEGGAQPFHASHGENIISFNGEIYNFRDLRRTLPGVRWKTQSDTEVLAEGLAGHGASFVERLRGMFAFAWWSGREEKLRLVRDRFGEKPLYFATTNDGFLIFASETGAIRASGLVEMRLSAEAMRAYFHFGFTPDPLSIHENIFKLPPASVLTAERGCALRTEQYWRPRFEIDYGKTEEVARRELLDLLDDAVSAQTICDTSLGAFLSGGVDSSAIVASLARRGSPVTTCTIGFENRSFDERREARLTASRYNTDHHEEAVDLDVDNLIDRAAAVYGEPFADPSALATLKVCAAARRRVKVALSGDGGDEIFAGYRRYPIFAAEERARAGIPRSVRRAVFRPLGALYPKLDWAPRPLRFKTTFQALGEERAAAYSRAVSMALSYRVDRFLAPEFESQTRSAFCARFATSPNGEVPDHAVNFARNADMQMWLPGRMLTKIDRASMAHGLEVRAPFLDHRLAEWAFTLPPKYLLGPNGGKRILKAAQASRLNAAILKSKKRGFAPPIADWLRRTDGPLDRLKRSDEWRSSGLFNARYVGSMIRRHRAGAGDYSQELWTLIMFDAFLRCERALQR
ncbi:MAG: asparagine synthase (glutamine-hydrolyzing) [Parvularculaceae bacterium]|nr:asparagine synthase (glutamine-hydrolyzing) [Parvularculaceae bacterium]